MVMEQNARVGELVLSQGNQSVSSIYNIPYKFVLCS
jgi:hypothetical protein